jgi:hypothetical protein
MLPAVHAPRVLPVVHALLRTVKIRAPPSSSPPLFSYSFPRHPPASRPCSKP